MRRRATILCMQPFALSDGRVRLSPHRDDEYQALADAIGVDDSVLRYIPAMPQPYTADDAQFFVEQVARPGWQAGTEAQWAVRELPEGWQDGDAEPPILGGCGLVGIGGGSAEIGWWLTPSARGRGLLSAAARLVVEWAFADEGLALERLKWRAETTNWASRKVAWRLGFRVEGLIRKELPTREGQERKDGWIGTLLREDPREPNEPWPVVAEAPAV